MSNVEELCLNELSMPHIEEIGVMKGLTSLQIDSLDAPGSGVHRGLMGLPEGRLRSFKAKFLSIQQELLSQMLAHK